MWYHMEVELKKENNFVFPDFKHSIVNLAATMADFLGKPTTQPTLPSLASRLKHDYKNIVYLVIDGMGSRILEKNLPANSFLRRHQVDTVTSVFPSTTTSATRSLTTGLTPADHGWFAWSVDFDGEVIELFKNRNFYTRELTADREFAQHHLPVEKFFEKVTSDRKIYSCFSETLTSKVLDADNVVTFRNLRQMFHCLQRVCQQPDKKFIYGYYADLDTVMHGYGTTARRSQKLLKKIQKKIARLAKHNPDSLFVITADHGQTDVKGFTYICDDAELQACLAHPVSLDPRGACFKIKPEKDADFRAAFQKYTEDFTLFSSHELIEKGVFGEFKLHPEYKKYLGDYIAVGGTTAKMLVFDPGDQYQGSSRLYHGAHTGMTADEMLVPLIVVEGGK